MEINRSKFKVYIAGPYTLGDVCVNVKAAMDAGNEVLEAGYNVKVPHLYHFMHMNNPHHYQTWIDTDLVWLEACDALIRLPGESSGSDAEVVYAEELGLPVFYSVDEFLTWAEENVNV